jgi:hypothetical protein
VPWEGNGYKPVGYGFQSIEATINTIHRIVSETDGMNETRALTHRREIIREVDKKGIIATPANSCTNELVMEAGRLSILNDGAMVDILYGEHPHVALRRNA